MPLLTRFFSRNTLKEEACHWNRTDLNLKKLDELLARDKVKDGAVLYLNTSRSLLGKGVDFLSTREHTTSHSLLTPRGCSAETARRLEHTLTAQFADRYYGPEAEEARQYVLNAIAQHRQVVKSPQFAQAIHTLAHAKEMPRPTGPAQVASLQSTSHPAQPNTVPAGQAIGPFANLLAHLVPGIAADTPMDAACRAMNDHSDATKEAIKDLLSFRIKHHRKDDNPYMSETAIRLFMELECAAPVDPTPSVGDTSQAIGAFADTLKRAALAHLGYAEFAEIDETTSLDELLDNIHSRSIEWRHAIQNVLLQIIDLKAPSDKESEWPVLFGDAHMAARVLQGIEQAPPADPYADIEGADLFDYSATNASSDAQAASKASPSPIGTATATYSSADSDEDDFGSLTNSSL